jgi:hypothetical protein
MATIPSVIPPEIPSCIPKIIHQIWIGPKPAPLHMMLTWKEKHPDFEYILWNETEIQRRNMTFECQEQINQMPEINGKADIIRWEILYKYGGYFVDADSICIEPFDQYFENVPAFACFENEEVRQGLIATGTMGFVPKYPLCGDIIQWIKNTEEAQELIRTTRAWYSVGPGLLTKMLETGKYPDMSIYPSYCFLPIHFTGPTYTGHKKIYAYQEWGTAKQSYDTMHTVRLPAELLPPTIWYSVLITSFNTNQTYIRECLDSIRTQMGYFGIEVVWVDDGSTTPNSVKLLEELERFRRMGRFVRYIYIRNEYNMGTARSANKGLAACKSEIVFRMDSDDIMMADRMQRQIDFMRQHPEAVLCGGNIKMFQTTDKHRILNVTRHPSQILWQELYEKQMSWYMNNPTVCYRKSAILSVGGYRTDDMRILYIHEDYDLLARVLKKYRVVYNLPEVLVKYRLHPEQLTHTLSTESAEIVELRREIILNAANAT